MSNTVRSTKLLEAEGWVVDTVERWIPGANIRKDLFGFGDLFAIHAGTGDTLIVQTTSKSNISSRINKIIASPFLPIVRKAGIRIEAHGWGKSKGRWHCRREDIS